MEGVERGVVWYISSISVASNYMSVTSQDKRGNDLRTFLNPVTAAASPEPSDRIDKNKQAQARNHNYWDDNNNDRMNILHQNEQEGSARKGKRWCVESREGKESEEKRDWGRGQVRDKKAGVRETYTPRNTCWKSTHSLSSRPTRVRKPHSPPLPLPSLQTLSAFRPNTAQSWRVRVRQGSSWVNYAENIRVVRVGCAREGGGSFQEESVCGRPPRGLQGEYELVSLVPGGDNCDIQNSVRFLRTKILLIKRKSLPGCPGTSLLRNPSQTFFKKEVLPSSSDITVEDGHLQIIKPFEPASEEGETPWQDEAAPVKESSLNEDENLTQHQEDGAENSDDKGSEKSDSGKSDTGSLDAGTNLSLETQPVDPSSPPATPEDKDVTTAAMGGSPARDPHEAESLSVTSSNIDFELEISERASPREAEEASQGSEEKDAEGEGDAPAAAKEGEEEREQKRGSTEGPHGTHGKDGKGSEGHQLPSVLRSKEGGRARSSSVGHKVRFTGQCSLGESDNDPASGVQDDSRTSRRQGRRHRSKVHRSASVTGMDEEEREAATTRREYHTLLREIQALMSEVQRQRNDFRSELRSLTSTIIRRHNSTSRQALRVLRPEEDLPPSRYDVRAGRR
ncbi:uncharacterized protein LOC135114406 [Scylla paramamosain]|uniref:uncharacterized protein LOC135114406 n=1 Tax=Scylla paramamosain TaxID=85552 RepID=UPI0030837931